MDPRPVEDAKLLQCLEAARWAASSFNDQPWSWIVAKRENRDQFDRAVSCLMEANQGWAKNAGVLLFSVMRPNFQYNGSPNRVALHDLGQAAALMSVQAAEVGLQIHQMGGVNLSKVRAEYAVPGELEPQTAIAIGYPDLTEPTTEEETKMASREKGARTRKPLREQVFEGGFGQSASFAG